MSAVFYSSFLLWCLQSATAATELLPPENVTVVTMNTNYTVRWDWDLRQLGAAETVSFTTQYVGRYQLRSKKKRPNWSTACERTSHRSCDLTNCNLHYLGIYVLRVRANINGTHSDWVQREFCPDKDAALGPPHSVDLSPAGNVLDVIISGPLTSSNTPMKSVVATLHYNIVYWELTGRGDDGTESRSSTEQLPQALRLQNLSSSSSVVTLPDLKAWTWYCVKVQTRSDFYKKNSLFSAPHCRQTEGPVPGWQIFLYFLCSLFICFLVVLPSLYSAFWCFRFLKSTFDPSVQLPPHLKKNLCDSTSSDGPCLLTHEPEAEVLCDNVSVSPVMCLAQDDLPAPPSGLETNWRSSCQDNSSSSSSDSGLYSAPSISSLQHLHSSGSSGIVEDLGTSHVHVDQVKMLDMNLLQRPEKLRLRLQNFSTDSAAIGRSSC